MLGLKGLELSCQGFKIKPVGSQGFKIKLVVLQLVGFKKLQNSTNTNTANSFTVRVQKTFKTPR